MPAAQDPRLPNPQSFPSAGSSMAAESQQANPPPAAKEPTRARKACDECRRKKVRCEHGLQAAGGDTAVKRKRNGRIPAPSQGTSQGNSSGGNAAEPATTAEASHRESQAQSSQAASERPRRLGAGKRKLSEAFDQNAPSNASQRPRKSAVVSNATNTQQDKQQVTQQMKQRKKPGPKARNQSDAAPVMVLDAPETSPSPVEHTSPQPQLFEGTITVSIDLAFHQFMTNELDKRRGHIEEKWRAMCRDMEAMQDNWQDILMEMYGTRQFMDEWSSRFLRQKRHEE